MARGRRELLRLLPIPLGLVALVLALWAGLERAGWAVDVPSTAFAEVHGPLMVNAVLGTLIALERAVALGRRPGFLAPMLLGGGGIVAALLPGSSLGPFLIVAGSAGMLVIFFAIYLRLPAVFLATQCLGVALLVAGDALWALGLLPIEGLVPWWAGFLVLVIASERWELARVLRLTRVALVWFLVASAAVVLAALASMASLVLGFAILGAALLAWMGWLLRHDIARRSLGEAGLRGYIASTLVTGYGWLGVSGFLALFFAPLVPGSLYDPVLHGIFLGFTLSMIFAHAPIIFPAISALPFGFHRGLYVPVVVLNASLALRVAGDIGGVPQLFSWGALLNVAAIVLFALGLLVALRLGRARSSAPARGTELPMA